MEQMVFISSRIEEMKDERKAVEKAVIELWRNEGVPIKPWNWKNAKEIPSGNDSDKVQTKGITKSDIYVLILGSKYGNFEYGKSPTHKEYETACSKINMDYILIFIKEIEGRENKLDKWILELKNKHTYKPFKNEYELLNLVKNRLRDLCDKRSRNIEVVIKKALHGPQPYYRSSNSGVYREIFDANELNIGVNDDDNSKLFIEFFISSIIHNKTDRNTTINNIILTMCAEDKNMIPLDCIKFENDKWKDYNCDEFTCKIEKQSSKRLFFGFISRDFHVKPKVSIELTLNHTFGDSEVSGCSEFIEEIGNIKWVKGIRQNNRENKFIETRSFLIDTRLLFSSIAFEYYKQKEGFTYDFPLIIKDDWIPESPIELGKIQLSWRTQKDKITQPILKSFPAEVSYQENIKKFYPEIKLENNFAYKLSDIHLSNGVFDLIFSPSQYFDYFNTCEVLSYEFCWALMENENIYSIYKHKKNIPRENLNFSNIRFPLRDDINIFDFTNRSTVAGISTLLIVLNKNKQGKHYYYFHKRQSKELAEGMNTFHVVPAGTFQPDSFNDNFHDRNFNLLRNILRELAEELLGKDELSDIIKDEKNFMEESPILEYVSLFKDSNAKFFFLGLGLDPLTTKPEILTCIVIDGSKVGSEINLDFKDNFEGEHFIVPFTKEDIRKYLQDENTLPAGAACLAIIEKQYEYFVNLF